MLSIGVVNCFLAFIYISPVAIADPKIALLTALLMLIFIPFVALIFLHCKASDPHEAAL